MGKIVKRTRSGDKVALPVLPPSPPSLSPSPSPLSRTDKTTDSDSDNDEDYEVDESEEEEEGGLELSSDDDADVDRDDDEDEDDDDDDDEQDDDDDDGDDDAGEGAEERGEEGGEAEEGSLKAASSVLEGEGDGDGDEGLKDVRDAVEEYWRSREREAGIDKRESGKSDGQVRDGDDDGDDRDQVPAVVESDSSEDERPSRNTIGNVPLIWYKDEEHIGYGKDGKKIIKQKRKDQLDTFLDRADDAKSWRKVYDEYNDEEVTLTKQEIGIINRIRQGKIPHAEVNPYEPYVDWFDYKDGIHPLSNAPEPKRRFIPSKWEAKAVVKLVRAIRKGWIKTQKPKETPKYYLLWEDDSQISSKTVNGLAYIPPPKLKPPGHEESYNPPLEYLPSEEELNSYQLLDEEDRPKFVPKKFDSMRLVPSYGDFIKEQFERCLDLYLCPRTRKKRLNIDPKSLIPKLPKPKDLQPFPSQLFLEYLGHESPVTGICTDPSGQWLASGSADGTLRLWEVQTGRCRRIWQLEAEVRHVAWNPNPTFCILSVAIENSLLLIDAEIGNDETSENVMKLLTLSPKTQPPIKKTGDGGGGGDSASFQFVEWEQLEKDKAQGLRIVHKQAVHSATWHHKGDYFSTVAPDGYSKAVMVHQLSKQQTQNPFKKNHGRVSRVLFHPVRPFFFVATKTHIRVYNLMKQQLSRKLITGVQHISSMDIHPGGDNLIIGSQDTKLCWFDMDLSTKPYRTLRYHKDSIRSVAFHKRFPLFASCADDGSAHVFHGMVYSDLLQNPLIVPLKILRGHGIVKGQGVLDCVFHPTQPWLFTAAADNIIRLFCN